MGWTFIVEQLAGRYLFGDRLQCVGGELEPCVTDPITGFFRDGCCRTGEEDRGSHTICAVVTSEFLEHQRRIGNDLSTPMRQYDFPGLVAGDRWCVTAVNWLRAHEDGAAAYVVLASTNERALEIVPLVALQQHAVADQGARATIRRHSARACGRRDRRRGGRMISTYLSPERMEVARRRAARRAKGMDAARDQAYRDAASGVAWRGAARRGRGALTPDPGTPLEAMR